MRTLSMAIALAVALLACADPPPPPEHRFVVIALSDGEPVRGVTVVTNGERAGETDEDGELELTLVGPNGATISLVVECPDGYRSPADLRPLRLHSFRHLEAEEPSVGIRRSVSCLPTERRAAFVVRTPGLADLPITIRDREVARTDASGVAHFSLRLRPNQRVRVQLNTSSRDDIRPQNPESTFRMPDRDEIFVIDQPFEVEQAPRQRRRRRPTGPRLPVRI